MDIPFYMKDLLKSEYAEEKKIEEEKTYQIREKAKLLEK